MLLRRRDRRIVSLMLALAILFGAAAYGIETAALAIPQDSESAAVAAPDAGSSADERGLPDVPPPSAVAARMMIPRIRVDAPLVDVGITSDGYMDTPGGSAPVGWYQHSARPGERGNAVFTGHVDYIRIGPAVFWNLARLEAGDQITIRLVDGRDLQYRVASVTSYALEALDMTAVLATGQDETVTLITCGGAFNGGEYDHRVVVRAVRTS